MNNVVDNYNKKYFVLFICFIIMLANCYGQDILKLNTSNLDSIIDSIATKYQIPGLSVGIVRNDTITNIHNYGYANMENKSFIKSETKFRVGSITKSFLALGFLKLVEEGKVDLDTSINLIAPEIEIKNKWRETNPVRIIHLLEHTAGLEDIHFNDLSIVDISNIPLIEAINTQKNSMTARWIPGSRYSYSSVGYTIAGYILEKITGEKYEDYLQRVILEPLNMKESTFYFPTKKDNATATGYEGSKELPEVYMKSRPAGSMISTTNDFSNYLRFLLSYGNFKNKVIYKAESIKRMETPKSSTAAKEGLNIGYGLGLFSYYKNGFLWFGHTGGGPGCLAKYAYCRDLDLAYIFMMNEFDVEAGKVLSDQIINLTTYNHKPPNKAVIKPVRNFHKQYIGYYELSNYRLDLFAWMSIIFDGINIEIVNDSIFSKSFLGKKTFLLPISDKLLRESIESDASAILIKTEKNGTIFQKGSKYYIKKSEWKPWLYRILFTLSILLMCSVIIVAIVWIPSFLVRKYILKKTLSSSIKLILFFLMAICILLLGIFVLSNQNSVELTQKTNANVLFYISTYLFTLFTFAGVYLVIKKLKSIQKSFLRIYFILVSMAFLGFTIFLSYWGIIGLKLWAF